MTETYNCRWSKKIQRSTLLSSVRSKNLKKNPKKNPPKQKKITNFTLLYFEHRDLLWLQPLQAAQKMLEASFHQLGQGKAQPWALSLISCPAAQLTLCLAGTQCPRCASVVVSPPLSSTEGIASPWQCESRPCS